MLICYTSVKPQLCRKHSVPVVVTKMPTFCEFIEIEIIRNVEFKRKHAIPTITYDAS